MEDAIFTNKNGYEVYAVRMKDIASTRVSVECYIKSPKGEMSEIFSVRRRDLKTRKNPLDFFYDLDGGFEDGDIELIEKEIRELVDKDSKMTSQSKGTPSEIHHAVSKYIRENAEELNENPKADIFIRGKCGYLATYLMDGIVSENRALGFRRKDMLKTLKIMGVLKTGMNRPYDNTVAINGERKRVYIIELANGDTGDDTVYEEIQV